MFEYPLVRELQKVVTATDNILPFTTLPNQLNWSELQPAPTTCCETNDDLRYRPITLTFAYREGKPA